MPNPQNCCGRVFLEIPEADQIEIDEGRARLLAHSFPFIPLLFFCAFLFFFFYPILLSFIDVASRARSLNEKNCGYGSAWLSKLRAPKALSESLLRNSQVLKQGEKNSGWLVRDVRGLIRMLTRSGDDARSSRCFYSKGKGTHVILEMQRGFVGAVMSQTPRNLLSLWCFFWQVDMLVYLFIHNIPGAIEGVLAWAALSDVVPRI